MPHRGLRVAAGLLLLNSCALHFPEHAATRRVEVRSIAAQEPATVPVVLFADNLHTGLIFELPWLEKHGFRLPSGLNRGRYVAFSWGDETAYVQTQWLSPTQVVHALFLPSRSVMEVVPFEWHPPEVLPSQRLYQGFVPDGVGPSVAEFLNNCSVRGEDGLPVKLMESSWGHGVMVKSPHAYYFPRICNAWTVDALNAAGFHVRGVMGLSADGVIREVTRPENGFQQIWDSSWQGVGL